MKKVLAFSRNLCYHKQVVRQTTKYPGVAKFGIALEWGSRGLEFESRHSDQKIQNSISCSGFFLSDERFEPLNATVRWTVACRQLDGGNTINYLSIGKIIANESRHSDPSQAAYIPFLLFRLNEGFGHTNLAVRVL